jgi:hypothetical protein
MTRVVFASTTGFDPTQSISSNHRCCAERNLLLHWRHMAARKGIGRHKVIPWIKRKVKHLIVFRLSTEGTFCVSYPCVFCRKEIERFDLHCTCIDEEGAVQPKLRAEQLPQLVLTSSQRRLFHVDE